MDQLSKNKVSHLPETLLSLESRGSVLNKRTLFSVVFGPGWVRSAPKPPERAAPPGRVGAGGRTCTPCRVRVLVTKVSGPRPADMLPGWDSNTPAGGGLQSARLTRPVALGRVGALRAKEGSRDGILCSQPAQRAWSWMETVFATESSPWKVTNCPEVRCGVVGSDRFQIAEEEEEERAQGCAVTCPKGCNARWSQDSGPDPWAFLPLAPSRYPAGATAPLPLCPAGAARLGLSAGRRATEESPLRSPRVGLTVQVCTRGDRRLSGTLTLALQDFP